MKLIEKMKMDRDALVKHGPITIVAFGDSVTHGGFAGGEVDQESVYHRRLVKKILELSQYIPVNMINAGIGGLTAMDSLERMERHVFAHNPDLVIIAFGLNDVNGTLDAYLSSLRIMFENCHTHGTDVIFMTPNMFNTYVADGTEEKHIAYAYKTAEYQNSGIMDMYVYAAVDLAKKMGVPVADCYTKWKELSKTTDTTMLLANRINHPSREMHQLFADTLFETIFDGQRFAAGCDSTMYIDQKGV